MDYEFLSDEHNFPHIIFKGVMLELLGESYMENPFEFYLPIMELIKECLNKNNKIIFNNKVTYYNTSSIKCIVELLDVIKKYENNGSQVEINWYCYDEDEDAVEEIEEISELLNLKIIIRNI